MKCALTVELIFRVFTKFNEEYMEHVKIVAEL